jgi:hypothetical protein
MFFLYIIYLLYLEIISKQYLNFNHKKEGEDN